MAALELKQWEATDGMTPLKQECAGQDVSPASLLTKVPLSVGRYGARSVPGRVPQEAVWLS